jgi:hypothetical protein
MNQQQIDMLARLLVDRAGGDMAFQRQIHDAPQATLGALGIPAEAVPPLLDQVQALEVVRAWQLEGRTAPAPPPRASAAWAAVRDARSIMTLPASHAAPAARRSPPAGPLATESAAWTDLQLGNYAPGEYSS